MNVRRQWGAFIDADWSWLFLDHCLIVICHYLAAKQLRSLASCASTNSLESILWVQNMTEHVKIFSNGGCSLPKVTFISIRNLRRLLHQGTGWSHCLEVYAHEIAKAILQRLRLRPFLTLSMRMTEAPWSARTMPQNGAGARPASSTTFTPRKAITRRFQTQLLIHKINWQLFQRETNRIQKNRQKKSTAKNKQKVAQFFKLSLHIFEMIIITVYHSNWSCIWGDRVQNLHTLKHGFWAGRKNQSKQRTTQRELSHVWTQ